MTDPARPPWIAQARKFLIAVIGFAADVLAAGLVHGQAALWLQTVIAIATAAGIYTVPNASASPVLTAEQWAAQYGKHARPVEKPAVQQEPDEAWTRDLKTLDVPTPNEVRAMERPTPHPRTGIHAHPTKKLGKLAPIPGRAAVPFGRFVSAAPAHPIADPAPDLVYPMDRNDVAGDCVVAGLDHTLQTIAAALGVQRKNWSDAELLAYYRTQNPGMKTWADAGSSNDRGMIIQTFLEYLVAQGVILAFGKIDHTNPDEMRAATYLGLAIVTGETLETAQQTQAVWDYKKSGDWGGHCTCTVGYPGATRQTCVSWGAEVDMTEAFIAHQLDEAWFVLTQAHVDHPGFRAGFDLAGFSAAVAELTGGKVVVPVPAPVPDPVPTPTPSPIVVPADKVKWAKNILTLKHQTHDTIAVAHWILGLAGQ